MFPIGFEVEIEGVMTVRDRRAFGKLVKIAFELMVRHWHDVFLPLHFTKAAFFRYPGVFRKRSRRKRGPPNVRTGRMKRALTQTIRVTGTEKQMVGIMRGPAYTDLDVKGQPDKAREITTVNRQEVRSLARFLERVLAGTLNRVTTKRRVRISA